REAQRLLQAPAPQKSEGQRPTEAVSGAQAVHHLHEVGRNDDGLIRRLGEYPVRSLFDDGDLYAALEEGVGGADRIGLAHRDLALLLVPDRDRDVFERRLDLLAG